MSGLTAPSDAALTSLACRFAVFLRPGSAVACATAALLAGTGGVSGRWLVTVLAVLAGWSLLFVVVLVRWGPLLPLIVLDAGLVTCVVLAQDRLALMTEIRAGTTWTLMLASTAVFIAQLTLRPVLGLPIAAVVTTAYYVSTDTPTGVWFLPVQALVVTYLIRLLRRGGHNADTMIASALEEIQQARLREERRADEREQYRRLHDTVLSTLVMVASGAFDRPSAVVSVKAHDGLVVLAELAAAPRAESDDVALLPLLSQAAGRAFPLEVTVSGNAPPLPHRVAWSIAGAVAEALENVDRHAHVGRADVRVRAGGRGGVLVEVIDRGTGFDPGGVPSAKRGIRESIEGRMIEVGGDAEVLSGPGNGTRVVLRWPR